MANSYNSNPIYIDTDIATGWRANQTLNTSNLPTTLQQFSGTVTSQWGIRVIKLQVVAANASPVAGTVTITDPKDSTQLFEFANTVTSATVGQVLFESDVNFSMPWRDFIVTGATAAKVAVVIWYR